MTRGTLFCLAVLLCACGEAAPPPSLQDAQIVFTGFDSVTMELRRGEGEAVEGDMVVARGGITDWVIEGDPDGDESTEALAVAWVSGGGGGTFMELALFELTPGSGAWRWQGAVALGDRVRVRAMTLDDDTAELHLTEHGPDDAMCCPTERVVRRFRVTPSGIEAVDQGDQG